MEYSELLPQGDLLSSQDVASELSVTYQHVNHLCATGKLPARKVGRCWVITRAALEWYKEQPTNGRGNPDFGTKYKGRSKSSD